MRRVAPRVRQLMDEISSRLDALEAEFVATAPQHLPRTGKNGKMPVNRIAELRDVMDWSIHMRERLGGAFNLRRMGERYGVSYQTVSRYWRHEIGMAPRFRPFASTAGAGRPRA